MRRVGQNGRAPYKLQAKETAETFLKTRVRAAEGERPLLSAHRATLESNAKRLGWHCLAFRKQRRR